MDIPVSQFNFFDVFLLTVIGFSMIIGFARGFVRETLGIAAWLGAAFLAMQDFSWPRTFLKQWLHDETILQVAAFLSVFFVALLLFLFIAQLLSTFIQNTLAQSVDRSLGILFGLIRGCALVCALYLASFFLIAPEKQPPIVHTSKSLPLLEKGAVFLSKFLPSKILQKDLLHKNIDAILKRTLSAETLLKQLTQPQIEAQ